MMNGKNAALVLSGLALGLALGGPGAKAVETFTAARSANRIFVDGQEVQMEAYKIAGNNYLKLRDVGRAVGFNVYWDSVKGCVQVESGKPYTGEAPTETPAEAPAAEDTEAMKQDIVDRTNALRREKGIAALQTDTLLMQAAQVRAEEMAKSGIYAHTRPDGRKYNTVTDCQYMAENIHRIADWQLKDTTLPALAVQEWADSAGHLKNMCNEQLRGIGVGLARGTNIGGDPSWYCVQLFLYEDCTITWVDLPASK